jgi:hypothetical protein
MCAQKHHVRPLRNKGAHDKPGRIWRDREIELTAAKTVKKQRERGKPFPAGKSGNPNGRPAGSRNAATLAIDALLDGEGEALTRKAIALAKQAICRRSSFAWIASYRPAVTGRFGLQ